MRAGDLKTPATLQKRTTGTDNVGQPHTTWEDVVDLVWVDVRTGSGLTAIRQGDLADATVQYSVRMYYRADVKPGMRLLCNGWTLMVRTVRPDVATRAWMDLVCVEDDDG